MKKILVTAAVIIAVLVVLSWLGVDQANGLLYTIKGWFNQGVQAGKQVVGSL